MDEEFHVETVKKKSGNHGNKYCNWSWSDPRQIRLYATYWSNFCPVNVILSYVTSLTSVK